MKSLSICSLALYRGLSTPTLEAVRCLCEERARQARSAGTQKGHTAELPTAAAWLVTQVNVESRFSFMNLESLLTSFFFSFHTPNVFGDFSVFPSQHWICGILPHLTLPIQATITSCVDNYSSVLAYLSATIFGLLHSTLITSASMLF